MSADRSRLIIRLLAFTAGLGLLLAACGDDSGSDDGQASSDSTEATAAPAGSNCPSDVCMNGIAYTEGEITVAAGDTVTWTNLDAVAHTVTAGTPDAPQPEAADSGNIEQGETFDFTFAAPGIYPYFCTIHPQMLGTVVAE